MPNYEMNLSYLGVQLLLDVLHIIIADCLNVCNQICAVSLSVWLLNLLNLC